MHDDRADSTTVFEQLPRTLHTQHHTTKRPYWALISIVVICILFGGFWYYEQQKIVAVPAPVYDAATPNVVHPAPQTTSTDQPVGPDTLQESVINTAIPDYSKEF